MFSLMQNIFIVPAMQHGCRAKPLKAIWKFPCTSVSKQVFVQTFSHKNKFDLHENEPLGETHFYTNGLVLTQTQNKTWKWPITETKHT